LWANYIEIAEDYRHTPKYRDIYKLRSETIERVFADAKEKHGMRYTQLRGLEKVKMQVMLTFTCMNLKKLASWKKKNGLLSPNFRHFLIGMLKNALSFEKINMRTKKAALSC